ncbi:hypothetical protein [Escherichia coli]|uniref:hypothetical protein n=1 Tax=Escherichia coli TaxID=562 RepID=UPI001E497B69|nr:hypothetical protein [Escherichia coli]
MNKVLSSLVPGYFLWMMFVTVGHAEQSSTTIPVGQDTTSQAENIVEANHAEPTVPTALSAATKVEGTQSDKNIILPKMTNTSSEEKNIQKTDDKILNKDSEVKNQVEIEKIKLEQEKIQTTQRQLLLKIDELTKEMYLSNSNFGEKNGPGYYYRFTQQPGVRKTSDGFYYLISSLVTKKTKSKDSGLKEVGIRTNDFVTFSLKESFADGKVVSETPILTVMNDNKLPDVVKAAFSVGGKDKMVTIVSLGKQIYSDSGENSYPKGIMPETTIIYTFKIVGVHNNNSQEMNVLKLRG